MSAEQPAQFVAGQLVLSTPEPFGPNAPLRVGVQLRLRQRPEDFGSTARIQLVDGTSWVNLGIVSGQGAAYQEQHRGPGTLTHTSLPSVSTDEDWHEYQLHYDGSIADLFIDGRRVARVPSTLQTPYVWLQTHTRHDAASSAWGEFRSLQRLHGSSAQHER